MTTTAVAEELPRERLRARSRLYHATLLALLACIQLAWVALLIYGAVWILARGS